MQVLAQILLQENYFQINDKSLWREMMLHVVNFWWFRKRKDSQDIPSLKSAMFQLKNVKEFEKICIKNQKEETDNDFTKVLLFAFPDWFRSQFKFLACHQDLNIL